LGGLFDLLTKDRKALVSAGRRSERTLAFYDSHSRPCYIFAGATIRKIESDKIGTLTLEERNDLADLGEKLALQDVDERFVDAFIRHRRETETSEHTIHHDRQALRTALGLAKRARMWAGDLDIVFAPHDVGYEPTQKWISHDDAGKLLKAITLPHRRAYVAFILATGAELAGVERALREDIAPRLVRVRGTKNRNRDRDRFVPIVTEWQRELLEDALKHADGKEGFLFTRWPNALRSIKQACLRAEVPHVNRHGLRHTFSAWMKQEGVPNSELYIAMGHASTTMLERIYGKPGPEELAKAMEGSIAVRRAALKVIEGGKKSPKTKRKATG
jgi:integrase